MTRHLRFGAWSFCPDTLVLELDGQSFSLEPRVATLLEYFLANPGEVLSHEQLIEVVWDDRVVSDDAIRRAVSTLRHTLAVDGSDKLITTVHKKGYLANLPAVIEVKPVTVCSQSLIAFPGASNPRLLVVSVLLVSLLAVAWFWLRPGSAAPAEDEEATGLPYTLAVMPFVDLSEHADQAYLADGLAEELLGLLGRFSAFRVPARSSSFQFRDVEASPREVGAALGVRYLVEGSVRRDADRVRVEVRLVEASSGYQLWSQSYSRSLAELFTLQADIAAQVARALQVVLVEPERPAARALESAGPAGAEAYLEYLRARQLMASWRTADLELAIAHLQNVISLAPDFAPAYTRLAEAMLIQANDLGSARRDRVSATVSALVDKSMALEPELGETYALRAMLRPDAELALSEQDLRRSIALSPSYTTAYELLAQLLFWGGHRDEGLVLIDQARSLDPLWPRGHYVKALMMLSSCEQEEAAELAREALRVNPRFRSGLVMLGSIVASRGELAEAARLQELALSLDPRAVWVRERLHMTYLDLGELAAAREVGGGSFVAQWREHHFLGNHAAAGEMIYAMDPAQIEGGLSLWAQTNSVLVAAMTSGDYARARRYLGERFDYAGGLPATIAPEDRYHLLNLLLVWYGPDYDASAQGLIAGLWRDLSAAHQETRSCIPEYRALVQALAAVTLGRVDESLAVLRNAIESGGVFAGWHWIIGNHPGFALLVQEPGFKQMLGERQALLVEQRGLLARLRAEGAVPLRGQGVGSPGSGDPVSVVRLLARPAAAQ